MKPAKSQSLPQLIHPEASKIPKGQEFMIALLNRLIIDCSSSDQLELCIIAAARESGVSPEDEKKLAKIALAERMNKNPLARMGFLA
jgi:hypothetical protein